ncbi:hypothetical protein LL12F51_43190 [Escherichia coli]
MAIFHQRRHGKAHIAFRGFLPGGLNGQFLHIRHIKHLRHLLRCLSDAVTGHELNQIQTVTIAALAANPRSAPIKIIEAETILAPTFRTGAVPAVFGYINTQYLQNNGPFPPGCG